MPRKEYSLEIRDKAEELYVEQGLTYEEVAEKVKVASNTVKVWGAQGNWKERRKEHLEARRTLKQNLRKLRQAMMAKAAEKPSRVGRSTLKLAAKKLTKADEELLTAIMEGS